jgi:altronate dehydratase large subunit
VKGYRRADGRDGARNHVLVLPSVVCSVLAAQRIAEAGALVIGHQHGCAEVGDDVEHTKTVFENVACNPNIAGTLVVGLGCETVQGKELAARIVSRGHVARYAGLQAEGGTERTVDRGRRLLRELLDLANEAKPEPIEWADVRVGLDDPAAPFRAELEELASAYRATIVSPSAGKGPETHPDLASVGVQVIVSWCGRGEGPVGFAVCPLLAVSGDCDLCASLGTDFDIDGTGDPSKTARDIWNCVDKIFDGRPTSAEERGANDFYLRRLARTM